MAAKKKQTIKTSSEKTSQKIKISPSPKEVVSTPLEEEVTPVVMPVQDISSSSEVKKGGIKIKKTQGIIISAIIIIIILLYVFRSQFIAATVNGQPISRAAYNTELQKQAGKKTMNALVTKMIILQEAERQHVSVSDKEVNEQMKTIESQLKKQGQSLDAALKMQNLTTEDLKEQIKIQKLIEKMLGKSIQVSDKEVNDYIEKAKQANDAAGTGTPSPELSKDVVMQQLKQQKLSTQFTPWLQKLQDKAKVTYFINQ